MVSWNLMISINVLLYLVCWRIWSYGLELETSTILQTLIISDVKSHKIRHEFGWQSAECWSFDQILLPPGWNKSGDCRFAWQNETFRRLSSTWTIFNHSKSCIRHLILRNHTKKNMSAIHWGQTCYHKGLIIPSQAITKIEWHCYATPPRPHPRTQRNHRSGELF